jgi:3-hydroxyanthranilate 3,4-dioxygenase
LGIGHQVGAVLREPFRNDVPAAVGYADACARFNADVAARTCGKCGAVHPAIDLAAYGWKERSPA